MTSSVNIIKNSFFILLLINADLVVGLNYPFNSPYTKKEVEEKTLFSSFSEQPKHLDPARSYSENEQVFISQIYEPPYQYNYLIRPFVLEPLSASDYIKTEYFDKNNRLIANQNFQSQDIAYTVYTVKIKPNIYYQPHPCFTYDTVRKKFLYHNLTLEHNKNLIDTIDKITDFKLNKENTVSTREMVAQDFIYQIKRLADPKVQSPIFGLMSNYIIGLAELNKLLEQDNKTSKFINLNNLKYDISGLKILDKYTYQVKIKGKYPQFIYWFAMPFFSPMPYEADIFYQQSWLVENNISLDTSPVGTGPFMLTINNPNQKMVLEKNPYYHHGFYPTVGMPEDKAAGLLQQAGKQLPFLDKAVFSLEKESIPRWNKFLQGYYDFAGISSDNFNQAINFIDNKYLLSKQMQKQKIRLIKTIEPSIMYFAFNMLDPVVGGYTEKQKKLRQAIGIALDIEEFVHIFNNGRGQIAHDPIPSIVMSQEDKQNLYNKYLYDSPKNKKKLEYAKQLLSEAGYPNGIDQATNEQLILHYDSPDGGGSEDSDMFNWLRKQFQKLNIRLNIRATQYNAFQDKLRLGKVQIFRFGWNADYPDPENFLFLLLCSQSKVSANGENDTNYCNQEFDKLFESMQQTDNNELKKQYIHNMIEILQKESPWLFGFYRETYILEHGWNSPAKPLTIGNNNLKYRDINVQERLYLQSNWNQPIKWPIILFLLIFIAMITPIVISYYKKTHQKPKRLNN